MSARSRHKGSSIFHPELGVDIAPHILAEAVQLIWPAEMLQNTPMNHQWIRSLIEKRAQLKSE